MWDNPIKNFQHDSSTSNQTSILYETESKARHISDDSLKYVRWVVAGVTLGIFVVMTIAIAIATYIDIKRVERENELDMLEDDKLGELEQMRERFQ